MVKASRFGYVKRSPEQVKARTTGSGGSMFDSFTKPDIKKYKVRSGKNLIRIIQPTWENPEHYGYDLFVVYGVGPDRQSYLSLSRHGKGSDPLTEARDKAKRDKNDDLAKALAPKHRIGVWLIDRLDRQAEDEGPQFWAMPQSLDKIIATLSTDEDTGEIVYVDDPEEGCDISFTQETLPGAAYPTYPGEKVRLKKPSPLSADPVQAKEWIEYVEAHPIPDVLQFYSYDHISAVYNGATKPKDMDEEADDTPPWEDKKPGPVLGRVKPQAKVEPEDDEEEDVTPTKPVDDDEGMSIKERLRLRRQKLAPSEEE